MKVHCINTRRTSDQSGVKERVLKAAVIFALPQLALGLLKKYVDLPIDAQTLCTLAAIGVSMLAPCYLYACGPREQDEKS